MNALHPKDDVMLNLRLKGIQAVSRAITGEPVAIKWHSDHAELIPTDRQRAMMKAWLENSLRNRQPSRIRMNLVPVVLPVMFRVYGKGVALAILAAFFGGRLAGKAKD